jgi:Reverse transcriptase (RNA-dependent DNA polymerase)
MFKKKMNPQGEIERYKTRLVVKGYRQKAGIDYDEVFAPVAQMETIRLLISVAAQHEWSIYQMDMKSAFLNGVLEEEIYVEQPLGYMKSGKEQKVLKLKKSLYGLKQAPRAWNTRIDGYFMENDFRQCMYEHVIYVKSRRGETLIVALYVDDLIFMGNSSIMVEEFKGVMMKEFKMTNLILIKYFLGLEIKQHEKVIFVSQEAYAKEILKRFRMENYNPIATPMELGTKLSRYDEGDEVDANLYQNLVGSLRYLTCTRSDIMFVVGVASRYMESLMTSHWKATKRILRYVRGTVDLGLHYSKTNNFKLAGYSNSDWCGDIDNRKSISGFTFYVRDSLHVALEEASDCHIVDL